MKLEPWELGVKSGCWLLSAPAPPLHHPSRMESCAGTPSPCWGRTAISQGLLSGLRVSLFGGHCCMPGLLRSPHPHSSLLPEAASHAAADRGFARVHS